MLVFRSVLLLTAVCLYFFYREALDYTAIFQKGLCGALLWVVWLTLVINMLYRFFPNRRIATGARKHFACTYSAALPTGNGAEEKQISPEQLHKGALLSGLGWFVISAAVIVALFLLDMLSPAIILIFALVYAAFDLIFVLFFCPLQAFFMHNRCCVSCRIYNWDYFMICAPLIVFPNFYSVSLFLLSLAVLLRWEIAVMKTPHYFTKETNASLTCKSCDEKLCRLHYKTKMDC